MHFQKRQQHLAHQAELGMTKYASDHNLNDAAVTDLYQLLQALISDSYICKILSLENINAMMLVRRVRKHERNDAR